MEEKIDKLAQMVAKGFEEIHDKFGKVNSKMDKGFAENRKDHIEINDHLKKTDKRLTVIEFELTELAHRAELEQMKSRITALEEKIGI